MRAVVCTRYGPPEVLQLKEVPKPSPKDDEVLVRILAVAVGVEDPMQRRGRPYFVRLSVGFTKPRRPILGTEFAGTIEAVGAGVERFKTGDAVFGVTGAGFGCNAEYVCMPEDGLLATKLPATSFEEAAPVCGSLLVWNLLKAKANIKSGQSVLIMDASGGIGSAAVQIAKALGAEVTGVCSTADLAFVESLGADKVVDCATGALTTSGRTYDAVLDATGITAPSRCKKLLRRTGVYLTAYPTPSVLLRMLWTGVFGGKRVIFSAAGLMSVSKRLGMLNELMPLLEEGRLRTFIDRSFRLDQVVEAHRYVEEGRMRGNVVLTVTHGDELA
ncbi:MAG: NAD(P)-dependent alcohol dehydrogenase [Acidobacteria bacterium]|nr:NAD(P)-dependent alcohol dehydrogenase [Acidobacteriota bacterium]